MRRFFTAPTAPAMSSPTDSHPRRRAFTLLELVVALVVLIILSALAIPTFASVITSSKVATTEASLNAVYTDARALCVNHPTSAFGGCLTTAASETTAAAGAAAGQISASPSTYWTVAAEGTPVTTPGVIGWTTIGTAVGLSAIAQDGTTAVYVVEPANTTTSCPAPTGGASPVSALAGSSCTDGGGTTTTVPDTTTTVPDTTTTTAPPTCPCTALVAGTGANGNPWASGPSGDGGPATAAVLGNTYGSATSADGNIVYIIDNPNNQVRAVNRTTGDISTFAGTGATGYSGDGGAAADATFNNLEGIAVAGNTLYLSDTDNSVVRAIDLTTNQVSTFAGIGGVAGDFGNGGPAASALLWGPEGLSVSPDGTTLYIADTGANEVRSVDIATTTINLVAGTSGPGAEGDGIPAIGADLGTPSATTVSADNSTLYITGQSSNTIRAVNLSTGLITTIAGDGTAGFTGDGGPATSAELNGPNATVLSADGNTLYIADGGNGTIRGVNLTTGTISSVVGTGTSVVSTPGLSLLTTGLGNPTSVSSSPDGHTLYISSGTQLISAPV